jgi:hypothetical protein
MKAHKYHSFLIIILFFFWGCHSPQNEKSIQNNDTGIEKYGKKINFLMNAVVPYNIDECSNIPSLGSSYKIITYVNLHCEYCWEDFIKNKDYLKSMGSFPNVSFFCFIASDEESFDNKNKILNLDFPVYLDVEERFKRVNMLGDFTPYLTFLLNNNNEIVLIGEPSNHKTFLKYISIVTENVEEKVH